ncbi:MAG: hypothetical protein II223_03885 [Treponema sp.]|nr:hypothetical protein [Treponema sp.]MBQ5646301.1 hypothetical protein [Treponema sp.]
MLTVKKSSVFPAAKDEIFRRLQKLKTLQYIAHPYATFKSVDDTEELTWQEDSAFAFHFKLFALIPFGVHTIKVIQFDIEKGIYTQEGNKHVPVWNHKIILEKIDENTTKYTDIVEIQAGGKTLFVYLWANCFYAHRQRKWKRLLKRKIEL